MSGYCWKISGSDFIFLVYLNWEMSTEKLIYPRVPGNNVSYCPILQTCKCKTDKMDINHFLCLHSLHHKFASSAHLIKFHRTKYWINKSSWLVSYKVFYWNFRKLGVRCFAINCTLASEDKRWSELWKLLLNDPTRHFNHLEIPQIQTSNNNEKC